MMQRSKDGDLWSRPVWGGWIEIALILVIVILYHWSRPVWGGWIEIP